MFKAIVMFGQKCIDVINSYTSLYVVPEFELYSLMSQCGINWIYYLYLEILIYIYILYILGLLVLALEVELEDGIPDRPQFSTM